MLFHFKSIQMCYYSQRLPFHLHKKNTSRNNSGCMIFIETGSNLYCTYLPAGVGAGVAGAC